VRVVRGVAARCRVLGPPEQLLGRLRWSFLAFGLFFLVTFLPQLVVQSPKPAGLRAAAVLSHLLLAVWWVRCYRRGAFPSTGLPLEAAAFALAGFAADDPFKALGLLYISVNFRSLYGDWRRTVGFLVLALAAFLAPIVVTAQLGGVDRMPQFLQSAPGVPVLAVIARLVAVASERGERAARRERILSVTGLRLALATDREQVHRLVGAAVTQLAHPARMSARLVLDEHQPTGALVLPMQTGAGLVGWLAVDGPDQVPPEAVNSLEVLAAQVALGLSAVALTEDLRRQARYDALTGLPNRAAFAADSTAVARGGVAVLLLDLDGFKQVNDSLGHAAGDHLLVAVAQRLRALLGPDEGAYRLGGDEFVLTVRAPDRHRARERAEALAARVRSHLVAPVQLSGLRLTVRASVGLAVGHAGEDPSALLHRADCAMYEQKRARRQPAPVR
jgi:diguanylate cyclase (GGDEF)-like protein